MTTDRLTLSWRARTWTLEYPESTETDEIETTRTGRRWVGKCPLHRSNSDTLSINERAGLWYCFQCGRGGTCR